MVIDSFKITVKEHKGDWSANIFTLDIPYKLNTEDYIFYICGGRNNFYASKIVKVEGEFITIFDGFWEKGITLVMNSKLRFYPFPMFINKPNFRNKTNLDFYEGKYGGWERYAKKYKDEWPRNFDNVMFRQLSMF